MLLLTSISSHYFLSVKQDVKGLFLGFIGGCKAAGASFAYTYSRACEGGSEALRRPRPAGCPGRGKRQNGEPQARGEGL